MREKQSKGQDDQTTPSASRLKGTRSRFRQSDSVQMVVGWRLHVRASPPHRPAFANPPPSRSPAADSPIHLHSLPSFSLHRTFSLHTGGVSDVAFSADSTLLASASDDRSVRIWEITPHILQPSTGPDPSAEKGERSARVLQGHLTAVFCVAWSPRGDLVASGGMDETVRVWDVQKGACIRSHHHKLRLTTPRSQVGCCGFCRRTRIRSARCSSVETER